MKQWENLGQSRYQDEHQAIHLRIIEVLGDDERGYLVKVYEAVQPAPPDPGRWPPGIFPTVTPSMLQADNLVFMAMTKEQIKEFLL